ncbi:MAG TPA: hypothetical protein VL728_19705 [Cyclobacteriaceae bacterium]|jgi:hypothetical protein|nr:hypothetical protein [Cyclobacteriaceae bacterium]
MKLEDLKCEHCDGQGEKEKFVQPYGDSPITCTFCNATGIDHEHLRGVIMSLHKGDSEDLVDKGYNEAIEEIIKLFTL